METYRKKNNRCGAGRTYPCPKHRSQLSTCREQDFSVNTEQLLIFFLAVWFFYFFYFQD